MLERRASTFSPNPKMLGIVVGFAIVSAALLLGSTSPVAVAQSTVSVNIQGYAFNPPSIVVVIGVNNTVTWTNNDAVTHTVTANDGSFSAAVHPGQNYTHTFETPGAFDYHCSIHTYMMGTVTVLASGSTVTTSSSATTSSSTTSTMASSSATSSTSTTGSTSATGSTTVTSTTTNEVATTTTSALSSSTAPPSSSTSSPNGSVPEFPFQAVGVAVVTLALVGSFLALRRVRGNRVG